MQRTLSEARLAQEPLLRSLTCIATDERQGTAGRLLARIGRVMTPRRLQQPTLNLPSSPELTAGLLAEQ